MSKITRSQHTRHDMHTHGLNRKGDYEDPYKPAARSSLELTIMPAVGASSAFSIVVVPLSERNVSALAGAFSRPQLAAHHGTLTRDLDSLLAEAQILVLYLLLALQWGAGLFSRKYGVVFT